MNTPNVTQQRSMGMSTETRVMLIEQLENTRALLTELWTRISADDAGSDYAGKEDHYDPRQELDELPLEIVWEKGEPFAVVLSTGGPHIEIRGGTRHDGMSYRLHGYWSGEYVTLGEHSATPTAAPGPLERTGEYFRELVDQS